VHPDQRQPEEFRTIEDDVLLLNLSLDGTTTAARLTNKTLWDRQIV
jgi:hypothetical protein